jgi:hypothetical protein
LANVFVPVVEKRERKAAEAKPAARERPEERLLMSDNNKSVFTRNFMKQLSRGAVKSIPFVGALLEQVIYGTLEGQAREKEAEKLHSALTDISKKQDITFGDILEALGSQTSFSREIRADLQELKAFLKDPDHAVISERLEGALERVIQQEEISAYCQKAESLHATLPVAGFVTQLKVPIDIEDIYVPLRAMLDLRGVAEKTFADAAHAKKCLRGSNADLEISLPEAFRQCEARGRRGMVVLGDPGSGKTTHMKRLLLWCLRNGPETLGLPAGMLPVFLPLRELKNLDQGLDAFIQDQLSSPHLKTPEGFGERLLDRGNLLFLLDGLDEVADLSRREEVAGWVMEAIRLQLTCRFVLTCRFAGYSQTVRLSGDFLEMHVRPLTSDQVKGFVHNWYRIVEKGLAMDPEQAEGIAAEKADHLVRRLQEPDFRARRVFELTRNPLLLTNICLVHRHRGALPRKRARLYEECIDVLLEHWREAKGLKVGVSAEAGRRALQPAALWMHSEEGRTRAKGTELAPCIEPVLKAVDWTEGTAEDFLGTIRDESGLLTGWDQEHYGFMHLGFQEYLAAREIRSRAFNLNVARNLIDG